MPDPTYDLWVNPAGQLIVVDYKATSKDGEVSLDDEWKDGYKRQMEIYQWILRRMGYDVLDTGYFVYANGRKDLDGFNGTLSFHIQLIDYKGDCGWVEKAVRDAYRCLASDRLPDRQEGCEYCDYRNLTRALEAC